MPEQEAFKTCTQCQETKSLTAFAQRAGKRQGTYYSYCRDCNNENLRVWAKNNPDKVRAKEERRRERLKQSPLRRKGYVYRQEYRHENYKTVGKFRPYGITREEFLLMMERQMGVCAICKRPETVRDQKGRIRDLAIDHNHKTGKVRGLLCFRCNTTLGLIESSDFISEAMNYLSRDGQNGSN